MKKYFLVIYLLVLNLGSAANAATYYVTEKVFVIKGSASVNPSKDWMSLKNTASIGACGVSGSNVVLRFKDNSLADRQLSIALTAKMGGVPVTVAVVDTNKDSSGYCYLHSISMQ